MMKYALLSVLPGVIFLLVGCIDSDSIETFQFSDAIDTVIVDVDLGGITVVGDPSLSEAEVVVALWCRTIVPDYEVYIAEGILRVELEAGADASACDGTFEISLPPHVGLIAKSKAGDIAVRGIEGEVDVVAFDGDVSLVEVAGATSVSVASGNVDGVDLSGDDGAFTTGAGAVNLAYTKTPSSIDVDVLMGHASLVVPSHAYYKVDARAERGNVDISDIFVAVSATNELNLTVASGDINLWGI